MLYVQSHLATAAAMPAVEGDAAGAEPAAATRPSPNAARRPLPAEPERAVTIVRRADVGFGLSICGGELVRESQGQLLPIVISKLRPGGPAAESGKLRVGDRILRINADDVTHATHKRAVTLLRFSPDTMTLVVSGTHVDWSQAGAAPGYAPQRQAGAVRLLLPSAFERVRILYNFPSSKEDELDLLKGDIVHVMGRGQDGWCLGESQRTHTKGFFPGNFAMKLRELPESIYADVDSMLDASGNGSVGGTPAAEGSTTAAPASRSALPPRVRMQEVLYEELPEQADGASLDGSNGNAGGENGGEGESGSAAAPQTPAAVQHTAAEEPMYEPSPHVVTQGDGKTVFSDGDVYAEVRRPSQIAKVNVPLSAAAASQTAGAAAAAASPYGDVVYGDVVYSQTHKRGDESFYSNLGPPHAMDESMYAKLAGEEDDYADADTIYTKLPSADGRPPAIPERNYNPDDFATITQIYEARKNALLEPAYEILPSERDATGTASPSDTDSAAYRSTSDMGAIDELYERLPPGLEQLSKQVGGALPRMSTGGRPAAALPAAPSATGEAMPSVAESTAPPPLPAGGARRPSGDQLQDSPRTQRAAEPTPSPESAAPATSRSAQRSALKQQKKEEKKEEKRRKDEAKRRKKEEDKAAKEEEKRLKKEAKAEKLRAKAKGSRRNGTVETSAVAAGDAAASDDATAPV